MSIMRIRLRNNIGIISIILFRILLIIPLVLNIKKPFDPEVNAWYVANYFSYKDLLTGNFYDVTYHNYFYFLFLKIWMTISISPLWLRLPSILFDLVNIFIIYKILNLLQNKKNALIISLLIAVSAFSIYWSYQIRSYSLLQFLQTFFLYIFFISQKTKSSWYFLLTGIIGSFAFWTEYDFLWVYIIIFLYHLYTILIDNMNLRQKLFNFILMNSSIFVFASPSIYKFITSILTSDYSPLSNYDNNGIIFSDFLSIIRYIASIFWIYLTNEDLSSFSKYIDIFSIFLISLVFISSLIYFYLYKEKNKIFFFLIYFPIISSLLIYRYLFIFTPRRIIIVFIGMYIVLGTIFMRKKILYIFIPIWILLNLMNYFNYIKQNNFENWQMVLYILKGKLNNSDYLSLLPTYSKQSYRYYSELYKYNQKDMPNLITIENIADLSDSLRFSELNKKNYCVVLSYDGIYLDKSLIEELNKNLYIHYNNSPKIYCKDPL